MKLFLHTRQNYAAQLFSSKATEAGSVCIQKATEKLHGRRKAIEDY